MKKIITIFLLALSMVIGMTAVASAAETTATATPKDGTVYVNTVPVSFVKYSIKGSDYYNLRDLAKAFNDTNKPFNVTYGKGSKTISINTTRKYAPVGGEMSATVGSSKTAIKGNHTINWSYKLSRSDVVSYKLPSDIGSYNIALSTYIIDEEVYVKLRDLMQWLDVGVGYDSKLKGTVINTYQLYVPPANSGNPLKAGKAIDDKYRKYYGNSPGSLQHALMYVYDKGYYYNWMISRMKEGQKTVSAAKDPVWGWVLDDFQVYNGKMYFEGNPGHDGTYRTIFRRNIDGTHLVKLKEGYLGVNMPQAITLYKGRIYANNYKVGNSSWICSYDLNLKDRKVLAKGDFKGIGGGGKFDIRSLFIANDRIYYMTEDYTIHSMKTSGKDKKIVKKLDTNSGYATMICAYDNYVYYRTNEGIFKTSANGNKTICVLPESEINGSISVYGNKIVYCSDSLFPSVVNTDGTSRYNFSAYGKLEQSYTPSVINSKYSAIEENVLISNSSAVSGYINLTDVVSNKDRYGWLKYSKAKFKVTDLYAAYGELESDTYNIHSAKNRTYAIGVSAGSKNDKAQLILWWKRSDGSQKFKIKKVSDGKYTIMNTNSGKYVTSNGKKGDTVYQSAATNKSDQIFTITYEEGSYRIADQNGLYLGISGGNIKEDTRIILWTKSSADSQGFALEYANIIH